jgi:phosphoserine phosphatase RsbU/P
MTDPAEVVPASPPAGESRSLSAERSLAALTESLARASDGAAGGSRLVDLLRAATRQCRRLVDCEIARIWLARRGGRRLVAREFPDGSDAPTELRLARGHGLAGWVFSHPQTLRIAPDGPRPDLRGTIPPFRSALVVPMFRRGAVFAAVECLDRRGTEAARGFTDADADHLEVAAEQIAFALDHALLYEETERRALEKEVLLEVAKALSEPLDLDEVLSAILSALREVVQYDAAALYLVHRTTSGLERVIEVGYAPGSDEALGLRVGVGLVGWVAKTGEPVIVPDVTRDPRYVAARPSTRSEVAAPLVFHGRTIGVFNLESDTEDAYHEGHLELLSAFAVHAGIAVERARMLREMVEQRRLEKELAIAREIQESFLPKSAPRLSGFELAGTARAHAQVGGDYYDWIRVSDNRIGLAIADVSGKGIPAALIMAGFRMSLLAEIRNDFAIRAVMSKVNSLLHESTDRDKFVTAFYGVLDHKNRVLLFSNAGHNPPILLRADGRIEYLHEGGVALGVLGEARYEERPIALRSGDVLVLYTDGVTEAESPGGEQFGQTRLEQTIVRLADRSAEAIRDGIEHTVMDWCGEKGLGDDLTLMVVKVLEEEAARRAGR